MNIVLKRNVLARIATQTMNRVLEISRAVHVGNIIVSAYKEIKMITSIIFAICK